MTNDVDELKKKVEKLEKRIEVLEKKFTPATIDDDALLVQAEVLVKQHGFASASLLQRRLAIGYARASRLIDQLTEKGVIGDADGAKPREVYVRDINDSGTVNT